MFKLLYTTYVNYALWLKIPSKKDMTSKNFPKIYFCTWVILLKNSRFKKKFFLPIYEFSGKILDLGLYINISKESQNFVQVKNLEVKILLGT